MTRNITIIAIVLILIGWGIYDYVTEQQEKKALLLNQQQYENGEVGIKKGNIAPDFELAALDGQRIKLSELRGKKVLLNFWASWCPPCKAEMPYMEAFHQQYTDEDVAVIGVNLTDTETSVDKVMQFIDEYQISFPIPLDERGFISDVYSISAYPTTYVIDANGIIQVIHQGAMSYDDMKKYMSNLD